MKNIETYFVAHPLAYVSNYVRYDFQNMNCYDFTVKYLSEMADTKLSCKRTAIVQVISAVWNRLETQDKYNALITFSKSRKNYADAVQHIINLSENVDCEFLTLTAQKAYKTLTGRNYDVNYFKTIV